MYSKIGKNAEDMFLILRQKEHIVKGKEKQAAMKRKKYSFHKQHKNLDEIRGLITIDPPPPVLPTKEGTSSFLSPTRESRNVQKFITPPTGHYDCNYQSVWKRAPNTDFNQRPKTNPRKTKNEKRIHFYSAELPSKHITAPVPLSKQSRRFSVKKPENIINLNPNFEFFAKKCKTPDMSKGTGRELDKLETTLCLSDLRKLDTPTSRNALDFGKYTRRQSNLIPHINNSNVYDVNYKQISKRVKSVQYRPETSPEKSDLPGYMKNKGNRVCLDSQTEKSMVMNNNIKGRIRLLF